MFEQYFLVLHESDRRMKFVAAARQRAQPFDEAGEFERRGKFGMARRRDAILIAADATRTALARAR